MSPVNVWARQFNSEGHKTKVVNDGGNLWVLGFKSEKRDTLILTKNGGATEMLGGLMQTSDGDSTEPMFINEDSKVSLPFCETNYSNHAYLTLVRELMRGIIQELKPNDPGFKGFRPVFYECHLDAQ